MIDVHNHLHDPRFQGEQDRLIAEMKAEGITACVVNGTCEEDWPEVARLAKDHLDFVIPAFGLHPWKVDQRSPSWLETLEEYLNAHPNAVLGEYGLDRWMKDPVLEDQHAVFLDDLCVRKRCQQNGRTGPAIGREDRTKRSVFVLWLGACTGASGTASR